MGYLECAKIKVVIIWPNGQFLNFVEPLLFDKEIYIPGSFVGLFLFFLWLQQLNRAFSCSYNFLYNRQNFIRWKIVKENKRLRCCMLSLHV